MSNSKAVFTYPFVELFKMIRQSHSSFSTTETRKYLSQKDRLHCVEAPVWELVESQHEE